MKNSMNNGTVVGFFARPVGNLGVDEGTNIVYTEVSTFVRSAKLTNATAHLNSLDCRYLNLIIIHR